MTDVYKRQVNGRVKATHQSESSIDSDKVRISIERSNNYDGYQVTKNYNGEESIAAYIGESGDVYKRQIL